MVIFLEVPNFGKQLMPYSGKFPKGPVFVIFAENLLTGKIKPVNHNRRYHMRQCKLNPRNGKDRLSAKIEPLKNFPLQAYGSLVCVKISMQLLQWPAVFSMYPLFKKEPGLLVMFQSVTLQCIINFWSIQIFSEKKILVSWWESYTLLLQNGRSSACMQLPMGVPTSELNHGHCCKSTICGRVHR